MANGYRGSYGRSRRQGFVRNNRDGSVIVSAEGRNDVLDDFLEFCYQGPKASLVKNIKKTQKPPENIKEFLIHF